MSVFAHFSVLALAAGLLVGTVSAELRTAADLNALLCRGPCGPTGFSLTALVLESTGDVNPNSIRSGQRKGMLVLEDATSRTAVFCRGKEIPQAGDVISISGHARVSDSLGAIVVGTNSMTIGRKDLPPAADIALYDLNERKHDLMRIRSTGTVIEHFRDEIDPDTDFLIVKDKDTIIPLALAHATNAALPQLLNARIGFLGRYHRLVDGHRKFSGPYLAVSSPTNISVLSPSPADGFCLPELEFINGISPRQISALGRRRLSGRVLAVWGKRRFLLKAHDGRLSVITLSEDLTPPEPDEQVTVAGFPQTDLFRINLTKATFRREQAPPPEVRAPDERPVDLSDYSPPDNPRIQDKLFGRVVRIRGTVQGYNKELRLMIACNGLLHAVDPGGTTYDFKNIPIGSEVEITGIWMMQGETWQPHLIFPHIQETFIIARTLNDIRILARPPWWTPRKLVCGMAAMLAALIGFFLWNRWLNRLVNRRSRELFKEQIASANAELRIDERTRLAAELHDSLSQNLSGIACQLNAAKLTLEGNPETRDLLQTTERMLQSCRTELTRCIWDLRGDTLEEPDFTAALHKTLAALALPAEIQIRFNVPRAKVSDSTAHAILCIVRELVTNAVRHGHATCVRVAGSVERNSLLFSVRDDGCGFDTKTRPDVGEGHFGLAGISDRISRLGGTFNLESHPGAGTNARIAIPLVHSSDAGKSAL